ncbi:MAG TPA: ABC transporter ATP-binding protein [Gemmatimonadaceae bacterium]|nr:ABC transporter ATP-binding protein [Gemmatimonadaceae bacterium]
MDEILGRTHQESRVSGDGSGLVVDSIVRTFSGQTAVDHVSFEVRPGELVALVGASGSGKTTTLRIVAGYEQPDSGRVLFDGQDITRLGPSKRDFGMVFQHYALFPHMSVAENVAFGLEARGVGRSERMQRAGAALDRVGLGGKGARMVQQLSGGEQQRVALARAAVIGPRLLLLDEPLSNLDPTLRQSTRDELRTTLKESKAPALFVTHDQDDAFAIADRIVLLSRGRVLQDGSPEDLYDRPATRDVAMFIGHATLIPAHRHGDSATVTIAGATHRVALSSFTGIEDGGAGAIVLRPEAVEIARDDGGDQWSATVTARRFAGAQFVYRLRLDDDIVFDVASRERIEPGAAVPVRVTRPVPMVP